MNTEPLRLMPHQFVSRTEDSAFVGPVEHTCHWCGCDPHNLIHAIGPVFAITDEALQARCEALADSLRALVSILRRTGGYMSAVDQREYREAEAMLVEVNG